MTKMYTKKLESKIEDRLLATHIVGNADFESACLSGNGSLIMDIVVSEMEKNNLYTKGSMKLKEDIFRMLQGKDLVPKYIGEKVLMFVWNSRFSGVGLGVL
jgi:hypothetical protein